MSESWIKEDEEIVIDKPQEMNIEVQESEVFQDWYGDYHRQKEGIITGGLYYYVIDETYIKQNAGKGELVVPPTDCIVSIHLAPYYRYVGLSGVLLPFDKERFPVPSNISLGDAYVCRATELKNPEATLGTLTRYESSQFEQAGGKFNWKKETKLQHFPYSYLEINDHVSTPVMVYPQLFNHQTNTVAVKIRQYLNHLGMYQLYAEGYKGDTTGLIEGVVTRDLSIPTTSNAYMDYMARNQNQFKQNLFNNQVGLGSSVVSGVLGAFSVNAGGNIANAINSGIQSSLAIANSYAQERDLIHSPATLRNSGGDTLFNYQAADKNLYIYRYRINEWDCERLGWYFHQFGYKQNKVMKPNLNSRYYYNYVKTIEANVSGQGVPKAHIEQIKQIFNNGVRIWHVSNSGVQIGDYTMDNREV